MEAWIYSGANKKLIMYFLALIAILSTVLLGPYSIALIAIPAAVIAISKLNLNSKLAFIFIICLFYMNVIRPLDGYKYLSLLLELGVGLFILKYLLFAKHISKINTLLLYLVSSFVILSFIQILNPNIPALSAGLQGFRKTALGFILFYIGLLSFTTYDEIKRCLKKFSILVTPLLLYGIKQFFFYSDFDNFYLTSNLAHVSTGLMFGQQRATSVFAGPFHFAMFSAAMTVLNLWLANTSIKRSDKLMFYILCSISILACYSSLVRTNLIALIVGVLVYILLSNIKKSVFILPLLTIPSILIFGYVSSNTQALLLSDNEILRLIGTISNVENDSRFLGRTDGWNEIIRLAKDKPLTAYGTGSSGDTLQRSFDFEHHVTSHNYFLKILMETGVVGLLIVILFFLTFVVVLLRKAFGDSKESSKLSACSLGMFSIFMVNCMTTSAIETYPVSGFIFFVIGLSLINFDKEKINHNSTGVKL